MLGPRGADGVFDEEESRVPLYKDPMVLREQILLQLRRVIDPDLHKDIVSCNFVKGLKFDYDTGLVEFTLELTTPACPMKEEFVNQCTALLEELEWVTTVSISLSAQSSQTKQFPGDASKNLSKVSFILAVSSCKGGVGKSSVAVNLGFMLSRLGAKVGICDCDVYGPSLHTLVPIEKPQVYFRPPESTESVKESLGKGEGSLIPCDYKGVKLMSYSFFRPGSEAYAAVRGPLASGLVYQMVTQTAWDELDYLLLDLPPGTGDIHLTISQSIKVTGAVVVTTPQRLSLIDVEKGINFFNKLKIPTLAIVENMAFTLCPSCGQETELFQSTMILPPTSDCPSTGISDASERCNCRGVDQNKKVDCCQAPLEDPPLLQNGDGLSVPLVGGTPKTQFSPQTPLVRLLELYGVGCHFRLPLSPYMSAVRYVDAQTGDIRFPFSLVFDEKLELWQRFRDLTQAVARELSSIAFGGDRTPELSTTPDGMIQLVWPNDDISMVEGRKARLACKCAECVDEFTGQIRLNQRLVPLDVHVVKMDLANNYAVRISWSDQHESLIAFEALRAIAEENGGRSQKGGGAGLCGAEEELEW